MKFNKADVLILIVPVIIMFLIMPFLPAKVPIHRGIIGMTRYIDRKYSFVLGVLPFVIYKLKYDNH